ncbi:protein DENND6A isoform X2 [Passer montanus]|uniref:protein DENND6A isoform X2 n=1 Tax=Passer montanus TaxID=9160 RepID=UPI0019610926|nr:protein DENND6A isoform X2 [Passer montanus]
METQPVNNTAAPAAAVTDVLKGKETRLIRCLQRCPREHPAKQRRGGLPGAGCGACSPERGAAFPRSEGPRRAGPGRAHRGPSLAGRAGALPPYGPHPPALPAGMVWPPLGARLAPPTPSGSGGSGRGDASHLTPRGGAGVGAMSRRERGPESGPAGAEVAAEDAEPESPDQCLSLLPWDRFSAWLHCVCVVGFDLELGQAVEVIYPPHSKLTDKEKTNICYLSFPDSNSGCLGDTQFCFRFRRSPGRKVSLCCFLDQLDRDLPVYLKKDSAYYYGYVYFRQVRDKSLKRGYFQKSLVLISKLPYVHLFRTMLKQIAPEYFEKSEAFLEAVCSDVDRWPPPVPGKVLQLPIMGLIMKADAQISMALPTVHEVDLFRCFCPVFFHIQMLWELVLLGEPLVVMAPSPAESSETVLALVSCISPLKYCSDFRPYFTIHDSEFKEYTTRTQAPPSVILGVTNPFFAKTLQHWPHIIRIGDIKLPGEVPKQVKVKKLKNLKTLDSKPGVYTSYKPYLNRDEEIVKQLQKGVQQKRPTEAQSVILRRYFLELTESFIIPLERYVASLMPLQKCISPWKSPPQLRQFSQDDFMKTLEKAGPQLTSGLKGDWIGLYRHFLKSPNFDGWFRSRQKEMTQKLEALHLEALCNENLVFWSQKHTEVETVDLVLKLKNKLLQADREHLPVKTDTLKKLQTHIHDIILALPDDLQDILLKTGTT